VAIAHLGIYDYLDQLNDRIKALKSEKSKMENQG
jgi:hypothetical protein